MECPDRWPYLLERLREDEAWGKVTIAACVKIAAETSTEAVTSALGFAREAPPEIHGSAYGWLRETARDVHRKRGGLSPSEALRYREGDW